MNSGQNDRSSTYLEHFIEGCYFLPTDLQRVLTTIKALDERCGELAETLNDTTTQLLAMPPAFQHPPGPEYFKLMNGVASDQKMLTQFSEEKVQLAQQAYDLLEMHALELERTMENFESDMRVGGMQIDTDLGALASLENLSDLYTPGGASGFGRAQTPNLEWNIPTPTNNFASMPLPLQPGQPPLGPGPSTIQATSTAGPGNVRRTGSLTAPTRTMSQKRLQRTDELPFPPPQPPQPAAQQPPAAQLGAPGPPIPPQPAPAQGPPAPVGTGRTGPGYKKRSQSVGPPMIGGIGSLPGDAALGFGDPSALPIGALPTDAMFEPQHPPPNPEGGPPVGGFMTPPPAGLKSKSTRPQVPGAILGAADITPMLRGRHAELYWPDDGSWYLIEIQNVEPMTRKAQIVYVTGEQEELDLEEIVRDRHMSLIPLEFYGVQA